MKKKNNLKILKFPIKLSDVEKKVEAILFSAAEPLNLEAIKDKLQTKTNLEKILATLEDHYKDRGINLSDMIEQGKFNQIPTDVFDKAVKDAYEFSYQSNFRGEKNLFSLIARGGAAAQNTVPFLVSAFLPFPRFVANQLKFQY